MSEFKPGCYIGLYVSSTEMHPDDIAAHLGIALSRKFVRGQTTDEESPATHPYHIALFRSDLSSSDRMEAHIEHMLAMLEPLRPRYKVIQDRCKPVIHCTCVVRDDDGWELSPDLLARMAKLGIGFCFALTRHVEETAD